jgi:hypothetical protein
VRDTDTVALTRALTRAARHDTEAPFRIQFDRYKCVLGLGNEWAVVDRRTGCVSEGFPFAAQAAAKCSGGGPYDLAYHNDTLVTATSSYVPSPSAVLCCVQCTASVLS